MREYLANKNTKEIHEIAKKVPECKIEEIRPEHIIWLDSEEEVLKWIKEYHYNGCAHCLQKYNTG